MLLLAGDIGGTKTILRLVEVAQSSAGKGSGGCFEQAQNEFKTIYEATYLSGNYPDLVPIVEQFLTAAQQRAPEAACLAIAGPVINNTSKLTNLNWFLDSQRLQKELEIKQISLINDFAAVCYGVLGLKSSDIYSLQSATAYNQAPIGVIGAGTGLGEGFLVPDNGSYQAVATEGGHTDFAPRSELEWQLLQYIQERYRVDRVSVERVVSGQGIVAIYQFLRDSQFATELPEVGEKVKTWEQQVEKGQEKTVDPAAIISQTALHKSDALCEKTMQMFVEAYGAEVGNFALKLLPYGGIYIAGGIAAKILPLMQEDRFLAALKQKGRMSTLLEQMPVHIVLNPQVGLLGSVRYATNQVK